MTVVKDELHWTTEGVDSYLAYDNHEPELLQHLTIDPGGCFIDVGAHVGRYAIRMAKKCKRVIAIEPVEQTMQLLYRNKELNDIKNMNIFNYAITNNDAGLIPLYSDGQPGHTSIYSSQIPKLRISDFKVYTCYTTTIDKTLDRYFGEPNYFTEYLIKVDVEGAELEVLQSAKETIKHLKPTWVIEVHPHVDMADIRAFLIERGYIIHPLFTYAPCHYIKAVYDV